MSMKIALRDDIDSEYLVRGIEYTVFAVYFKRPIGFMIQVDSLPSEPLLVSSEDVDVVDNRLSKFWVFGSLAPATIDSNERPAILAFPEWVNDVGFYENIVESKGGSGVIWREYREKMELEFAPSDLAKSAIDLGDGWLQCVDCSDAWVPPYEGEVVYCPSCSTMQRRPERASH